MNSFHIDFFIYKSTLDNFISLFDLLTNDSARLNELLSDSRTSRAYEACLLVIGGKIKDSNDQAKLDKLKQALKNLGDYFVENFENIIETQNGIFAMRAFLRIIGKPDVLEQPQPAEAAGKKYFKKPREFNIKNVEVKLVPDDWKTDKFIKKIAKFIKEINPLG